MRKLLAVALLALLPAAAAAQVSLSLRLGFAPAMGDEQEGLALANRVKSQVPLQADAMYAVTDDLAVGAYLSYGFGVLGDERADGCDRSGLECSASAFRLGVQVAYALGEISRFTTWVGAGLGAEVLSEETRAGGSSVTLDRFGFELLNLQGGADYAIAPRLAVGPYLQLSLGEYASFEGEDIARKGVHAWLNFGVRGKLDL